MSFKSVYLPIGVPTFDLAAAKKVFDASAALLKSLDEKVAVPGEMLLGLDKLDGFIKDADADLAIIQNVTFANGAYASALLRKLDCPVLLWTPEEPEPDTGRLKLNTLTGALSAGNTLTAFGRPYCWVYGSPDDPGTIKELSAVIKAAKLKKKLRSLRLLQIGQTPPGFGFGKALDSEISSAFGCELISIEARELIENAKGYGDDEIEPYLDDAKKRIRGLDSIDSKNVRDFARLYKAYAEYLKNNDIGALCSRCWPDFFTSFGTPVCAALSILDDLGVPAACEADAYGALSMYFGQFLTGSPAFFGDPVALGRDDNTITFWHCGAAPCSLAREDTGASAGVHCNRKIGPTLEFGCKAAKEVTILRVGKDKNGRFRMLTAKGEALDRPKRYSGTSMTVRTRCDAYEFVKGCVEYGWEPHYAVAYGDIGGSVAALGRMLGIEVYSF